MNKITLSMLDDKPGSTEAVRVELNGKVLGMVQEVSVGVVAGEPFSKVTLVLYADVVKADLQHPGGPVIQTKE